MSRGAIVLFIVIVVIAIGAVAAFYLRGHLPGIVASAIEDYGSRLTGTEVKVGRVDLNLRHGRMTIHELTVANPEGFSDHDALSLGELVLDLDTGTLRSQPYRIQELSATDVSVRYEFDKKGRRNLDVIRDHLQSAGSSQKGGESPPPRLEIDRLHLADGTIEVDPSALGLESRQAELSGFTLTGLGAPDGAPATAIGKQVVERLIEQAARSAVDHELQKQLEGVLTDKVTKDLGGEVKDKLDGLLNQGK